MLKNGNALLHGETLDVGRSETPLDAGRSV